jgi:hypothetical protein
MRDEPYDYEGAIQTAGYEDPNAPIGVPSGYVPPMESGQGFSPGEGPPIRVQDYRGSENPYRPGDEWRPRSCRSAGRHARECRGPCRRARSA